MKREEKNYKINEDAEDLIMKLSFAYRTYLKRKALEVAKSNGRDNITGEDILEISDKPYVYRDPFIRQ